MKTKLINAFVALTLGLLASQTAQTQGIVYLSNLGQPSAGSEAVANNSWFAADFITGTDAGGYAVNSVQLAMTNASGIPANFMVMLYTDVAGASGHPGSNLGTLFGPADPLTLGVYSYTNNSNLMLSPSTVYYIVVTAGTAVTNGAYLWSIANTPSLGYTNYHWGGETAFLGSGDGLNWNPILNSYGQFAITATPIPEPGVSSLFALGAMCCLWLRRKRKALE